MIHGGEDTRSKRQETKNVKTLSFVSCFLYLGFFEVHGKGLFLLGYRITKIGRQPPLDLETAEKILAAASAADGADVHLHPPGGRHVDLGTAVFELCD